jgi:hypothetical protein
MLFEKVQRAEEAFDPDVGAEFREEMAELNRDLGYDFERDFLALLGGQCAFGVSPGAGEGPGWVFACGLAEREKFIARAARLAEISKEPWAEKDAYKGARRFTTRLLSLPLELAVGQDGLLVGSSGSLMQAVLDRATDPTRSLGGPALPTGPGVTWAMRLKLDSAAIAALLLPMPGLHAFRQRWLGAPAAADVTIVSLRTADTAELEVRIGGLTPETLRDWLAPLALLR